VSAVVRKISTTVITEGHRESLSSGGVGFHPGLKDQDGGHPVDRLPPFLDRKIGFAQQAVGFG
jgi:hypothetical protein